MYSDNICWKNFDNFSEVLMNIWLSDSDTFVRRKKIIFSEVKTNFRTAITIPEKSWCKWVISSSNFLQIFWPKNNYFFKSDSETFLTTMWLGWKKPWRLKRVPRTSKSKDACVKCYLVRRILRKIYFETKKVNQKCCEQLNNNFSTAQIILPKQGSHKEYTSSHPQ